MASGNAKLIVEIITDASKAGNGIDEATGKFGKFNSVMGNLVGPATAVIGGIAALGAAAIGSASDLQQAAGGTEAVFGDSADQIKAWAEEASGSVGLSSAAYQTFASQIGSQLKNLGVPMDQVAGKTDDLISLGADLAATYGGTTEEAVSALGSAFRGEADPAERYGLALNQTAVNAELAARGQGELEGAALSAAKAQVIMEMATSQAGGALGQFGRESDTLAGQQQILGASIADMSAEMGTALLPIITPVVAALSDFAKWIQKNSQLVTIIIGVIGALAVAVIAYTVAQWAMNSAMLANPVFLIVAAIIVLIGALIALGVWIATNTEAIQAFFASVWESIQDIAGSVADWFVGVWSAVSDWFIGIWESIGSFLESVADWFRSTWESIASWFKGIWSAIAGFFIGVWNGIQSAAGAVAKFFSAVWNTAVALVQGYFAFWFGVISGIITGIQGVIGSVASFFASAWNSAIQAVAGVIQWLSGIFLGVFNAIQGAIGAVVGAFNAIVSAVKNVIDWIGRIKIPDVLGSIGGIFGLSQSVAVAGMSAASPTGFAASGLRAAPMPMLSAGSGGTTINVYGGLDSGDTIARRIQDVLTHRERRASGVTLRRRVG